MTNEIDVKFNIIVECANRILNFEKDLSTAKTDLEKKHLEFFIAEQKKLIEECTDVPVDVILPHVSELNTIKKDLEDKQDSKEKTSESILTALPNDLKSLFCKGSRESQYRNSQKINIGHPIVLGEKCQKPKSFQDKSTDSQR